MFRGYSTLLSSFSGDPDNASDRNFWSWCTTFLRHILQPSAPSATASCQILATHSYNSSPGTPEPSPVDCKPSAAPPMASAVTIKLPDFYVNDPEAWFARAEAQFRIHSTNQDETKYWYVLASLNAETSTRVTRITHEVKPGEKYCKLKNFMIRTFSLSRLERADLILTTTELGDRKP